jgi:hypothetical protein
MQKRSVLMMSLVISFIVMSPSAAQAPLHQQPKLSTQAMAKEYAKQELLFRGYHSQDWNCLHKLWTKESNWNHKADNPTSSAFGIAQKLKEKSKDYVTQINNGLRYIEHRYGNPCNAWEFWTKKKWY